MDRPYILHMFTPGRQMSPFDINMAADAGYQLVVPYTEVGLASIAGLTQDTIFSRGPKGVARTGIFIGGRDALLAADMLAAAQVAMVPPFVVSLMADPSGAYTTAAAMVACVEAALLGLPPEGLTSAEVGAAASAEASAAASSDASAAPSSNAGAARNGLAGRRVLVLGGTGPVGRMAGVIAARAGAQVFLSSRSSQAAADQAAAETGQRFGVRLHGTSGADSAALRQSLAGADVLLACAAAGHQVVSADDLGAARALRVAADVNAVPPTGIAGVAVMDNGVRLAGVGALVAGALGIGALAVGNVKYQTQQRLLQQMRQSDQPLVLGLDEAFAVARACLAERTADRTAARPAAPGA